LRTACSNLNPSESPYFVSHCDARYNQVRFNPGPLKTLSDDEAKLLMSNPFKHTVNLLPEQEAIRAKCFHPTGTFVEFKKEEVEQSISDRFEQQVRKYAARIAVKTKADALTYAELNQAVNREWHMPS
jgi:non-ribosomal peptide synthetase component F